MYSMTVSNILSEEEKCNFKNEAVVGLELPRAWGDQAQVVSLLFNWNYTDSPLFALFLSKFR